MPKLPKDFDRNVFINCPFDDAYTALLRPLTFTVLCLGYRPRLALERSDSAEVRIDKIVELIQSSRFGIHDLSRNVAEKAGEPYRLNMPLELGIDYACRRFKPGMKGKRILILERTKHQLKPALSDLAGCDTEHHNSHPETLIAVIRDWMVQECDSPNHPSAVIYSKFLEFMSDTDAELLSLGWPRKHIDRIKLPELMKKMNRWIQDHFKQK
ncbi:MAG: hypothetical protein B7Z47_02570 [Chthoniobacter sp. 12-60-6]|nr:MAG: hypothetical protein B7Z47_02570 [Chthoniobacter sp. 12-60-6]